MHSQSFGRLSEWLGIGLQNRERRFESATDLNKIPEHEVLRDFLFSDRDMLALLREENKKDQWPLKAGRGFCCNSPPSGSWAPQGGANNPPPTSITLNPLDYQWDFLLWGSFTGVWAKYELKRCIPDTMLSVNNQVKLTVLLQNMIFLRLPWLSELAMKFSITWNHKGK